MQNFDQFLNSQLANIKEILASKDKEYGTKINRLHNFDLAADLLGTTPEKALLGMMVKHIVSVVGLLKSPLTPSKELANEKLTDLQNYAILAQYMIHRRIETNNPKSE